MFGDDGQRVGGWFLKHKLEGKRNRMVRRAACCIWMGFTDVIQLKKLHDMVEVLDDAVLGPWKRYPDLKLLETATC